MQSPNYYETLGVEASATPEEIKKRYRNLARRFHPDVNPSPDAAIQIKRINEAYEILGDADRRAVYDAYQLLQQKNATPSAPEPTARRTESPRPPSETKVEYNGFGRTPYTPPPPPPPKPKPASRAKPSSPPKSAETLLSEARIAFVNRKWDQVELLCHQALGADAGNPVAYEMLGDLFLKRGQKERAITCYSYAIQFQPQNFAVQSKLERLLGGRPLRETPIRTTKKQSFSWGRLLQEPYRPIVMGSIVLTLLLLLGGSLWGAWIFSGGTSSVQGLAVLGALLLTGASSGMLLGFLGGMRPYHTEFSVTPLLPNAKPNLSPLHQKLWLFGVLWFYLSLGYYLSHAVRRNRLSPSLLRAYGLTLLLTVIYVVIYSKLQLWVMLFGGNLLFPLILCGWRVADKIRLSGLT